MVGESVIQAMLHQSLLHLGADLAEVDVVMEVLYIFVVADITTNCRVS